MQQLFLAWTRTAEAVARAYDPMWAGMARVVIGTAVFANQRLQAQMELASRLSRCHSPREALAAHAHFWKTAASQSIAASREILDAWGQAGGMGKMPPRVMTQKKPAPLVTFPEQGRVLPLFPKPATCKASARPR